ncbi:MAG: alpha/beta hydrolase [Acidimicrobiia bacterium]|nr:alpha/beta hydrolase [Acidimicrobiia bacterium]MDH5521844.1 alpha/beta hydrolase [Acidimicrobiia bacterium]
MTEPKPEQRTVTIETTSGLRIVGDQWDGGDPSVAPVVLAHGGGQTRHAWGSTARALAATGHRVLTIDLRGHGDSDWAADGDYAIDRFVDDAESVLDWIGRPVIWVGASLGGLTGLVLSVRRAVDMAALILVDITPRPRTDGVERILAFMSGDVERGFASLEEAADAIAAYQPHRPRPVDLSGLAKNLRRGDDGRWRWHWDPAFLNVREDKVQSEIPDFNQAEAAAADLTLPTLLVRGRLSDLVTEDEAREFLAMVPHAEYLDVAGAAHMVAGDRNDVFTEAVTRFVAKLDG